MWSGRRRLGWQSSAGIRPLGERINIATVTHSQIAATLAALLGEDYHAAAPKSGTPIQDSAPGRHNEVAVQRMPSSNAAGPESFGGRALQQFFRRFGSNPTYERWRWQTFAITWLAYAGFKSHPNVICGFQSWD